MIFILHRVAICHEYHLPNPKVCFNPAVYKKDKLLIPHGEFNITIFIHHRVAIHHEYHLSNPKVFFSPAVYKKGGTAVLYELCCMSHCDSYNTVILTILTKQ